MPKQRCLDADIHLKTLRWPGSERAKVFLDTFRPVYGNRMWRCGNSWERSIRQISTSAHASLLVYFTLCACKHWLPASRYQQHIMQALCKFASTKSFPFWLQESKWVQEFSWVCWRPSGSLLDSAHVSALFLWGAQSLSHRGLLWPLSAAQVSRNLRAAHILSQHVAM